MARCPSCHANINDWHILSIGKTGTIQCTKCRQVLKMDPHLSLFKILVSIGFLAGGVTGGFCVASPNAFKWIILVLIWFLVIALVEVRFARLQANGGKP
jgi:hypothetical protein